MAFNQTRDVLDHAREFHRRLIRFYNDLRPLADEGVTLSLLDDLIEHERIMEHWLADFEESASDNTSDTFFQYMAATTDQAFANYPVPDKIDVEYVIQATHFFDEKLRLFYESMAKKTTSIQVRDVLENLQAMEQRERLALSKLMLSLQEV